MMTAVADADARPKLGNSSTNGICRVLQPANVRLKAYREHLVEQPVALLDKPGGKVVAMVDVSEVEVERIMTFKGQHWVMIDDSSEVGKDGAFSHYDDSNATFHGWVPKKYVTCWMHQ
jgi:hypothetical protein